MSNLNKRDYRIWLVFSDGTTYRFDALDLEFLAKKSAASAPNTLEMTLYGLSADTRARLSQPKVTLVLEAGYEGFVSQLFRGRTTVVEHAHEPPEWKSKLQAADGVQITTARVNRSYSGATPKAGLLADIKAAVEKTTGLDLSALTGKTVVDALTGKLDAGAIIAGNPTETITTLLRDAGLEWSIQDESLVVTRAGQPTGETAYWLSSDSGLLGSPEVGKDGVVKLRTLLLPDIRPGRQIEIVSATLSGYHVVRQVTHRGSTFGSEWFSEIECRPF